MPKKPVALYLMCLILALFFVSCGIYLLSAKETYVKCNKFIMGDAMNNIESNADYNQLLSELNYNYFEKVCDIFDSAKNQMTERLQEILGDEYKNLCDQVKNLKEEAKKARQEFDNQPYTLELKEKLALAKTEFVEAVEEGQRAEKKAALNNLLSQVAERNLGFFSKMSKIKKEIDEKTIKIMSIIKQKEGDFRSLEKSVIDDARQKVSELAVSYKSQKNALSYAFDIDDNIDKMPFLDWFDPEIRLVDFDKQTFLKAFLSKEKACGPTCGGDCKSCSEKVNISSSDKNYFKSENKDNFKN